MTELLARINYVSNAIICLYPPWRSLMGYDWPTVKSPSGVGRGFPAGKVPGTNFDKGIALFVGFVSIRRVCRVLLRKR